MIVRLGLVSNSSSSSFIIKNKSDKDLKLIDFLLDNSNLIDKYNKNFDTNYTLGDIITDDKQYVLNLLQSVIPANKEAQFEFDDFGNDILNMVLHYTLINHVDVGKWEWWEDKEWEY